MIKLKNLFVVASFFILQFCFNSQCKSQQHHFVEPDSLWQKDSLGCNGSRLKECRTIAINLSSYIGLSLNDIIQIFGQPNFTKEKKSLSYIFWIGGDHCDTLTIKNAWSSYVHGYLEFLFNNKEFLTDIAYRIE